jgi:hypothetical protein
MRPMTDLPPVWTVRAEGHELDGFCTYAGDLPAPGDVIEVRQNITGKTFRARVTRVDPEGPDRHIAAAEIEP